MYVYVNVISLSCGSGAGGSSQARPLKKVRQLSNRNVPRQGFHSQVSIVREENHLSIDAPRTTRLGVNLVVRLLGQLLRLLQMAAAEAQTSGKNTVVVSGSHVVATVFVFGGERGRGEDRAARGEALDGRVATVQEV